MRHAVLIVLSVLVLCCTSATNPPPPCSDTVISLETLPRLGDALPDLPPSCMLTMVASSQTLPSYETVIDGAKFTIGVDGESRVRFVSTNDATFAGVDGVKIGDSLDAVMSAAAGESIQQEGGWGSFVRLPSGWSAFLDDSTPPHVTMFFLRE